MNDIPEDIAEHVLRMGRIQWGLSGPKSDEDHLADFASTLRLTREHFETVGDQELHGCYLNGTETVLCHTGVSPNSPIHARILVGLWNQLHDTLAAEAQE